MTEALCTEIKQKKMSCIKNYLTLYDSGGGALKAPPPLRFYALTPLILKLHYCALVTFLKKLFNTVWRKKFDWGHDLAVRGVSKYQVDMIFIILSLSVRSIKLIIN